GEDLDLKGIHAEDQRFQFVNGRFDGTPKVIERTFADAVDAFVGQDACEQPVLPGVARDVGFDGGDFHSPSSLAVCAQIRKAEPAPYLYNVRRSPTDLTLPGVASKTLPDAWSGIPMGVPDS